MFINSCVYIYKLIFPSYMPVVHLSIDIRSTLLKSNIVCWRIAHVFIVRGFLSHVS